MEHSEDSVKQKVGIAYWELDSRIFSCLLRRQVMLIRELSLQSWCIPGMRYVPALEAAWFVREGIIISLVWFKSL